MTLNKLLEKWIADWAAVPTNYVDLPLEDWLAIKIRESWPTLGESINGWRCISTAPLTHDVLLFCQSRNGEVAYCCIDAADSDGYFIEQATHWMPLPSAPEARAEGTTSAGSNGDHNPTPDATTVAGNKSSAKATGAQQP